MTELSLDDWYSELQDRCYANARAHCPECGRFARVVGGKCVYLGHGSEYRTTVACTVHGSVDIY